MASASKKMITASNKEVVLLEETQNRQTDGQNSQETPSENSGSFGKSSRTKKRMKHAKTCKRVKLYWPARDQIIRLRALLNQSEKNAGKWEAMVHKMLGERGEDQMLWRGDVEEVTDSLNKLSAVLIAMQPQHLDTIMEKGNTSANTEVEQVTGPPQFLPADSGTIHLAYTMLKERHAASEARYAQEITALVEHHAQEVATINMKHQQELDTLKQEARLGF